MIKPQKPHKKNPIKRKNIKDLNKIIRKKVQKLKMYQEEDETVIYQKSNRSSQDKNQKENSGAK